MRELVLKNLDQEINLETFLAVNPNLVLRIEDDDCALLFDPDRGTVQMLNQTAVAIWQNLDGQRSLGQVIADLHAVYEGMDAVADQKVIDLINDLVTLGAVGIREHF
jgi:hypothetical protein